MVFVSRYGLANTDRMPLRQLGHPHIPSRSTSLREDELRSCSLRQAAANSVEDGNRESVSTAEIIQRTVVLLG